jgi:hypothetical protein
MVDFFRCDSSSPVSGRFMSVAAAASCLLPHKFVSAA